jgi:hypothetical protein
MTMNMPLTVKFLITIIAVQFCRSLAQAASDPPLHSSLCRSGRISIRSDSDRFSSLFQFFDDGADAYFAVSACAKCQKHEILKNWNG